MLITEREFCIDRPRDLSVLLPHLREEVCRLRAWNEIPIRFVVTGMDLHNIFCEVGMLQLPEEKATPTINSIFKLDRRKYENTEEFNVVLVIPTGMGCELGGHSGDGGAVARLFASICDQLITHPNVVNAADINELPDNGLYVEGSILSRLLMGTVTLRKVRSNRVLLVVDKHEEDLFHQLSINAASSARAALGLHCPKVVVMVKPIGMSAGFTSSGRAAGRIEEFDRLFHVLGTLWGQYDAVALSTLIQVPENYHADYFKEDTDLTVNPWGGVEAMLTHAVSSLFNVPSAHSPMMNSSEVLNLDVGVVDPRKASEAVSMTFLHCILKGLHRAPRIIQGTSPGAGKICSQDISCLVIPDGCLGLPVFAAMEQGIPIIAVRDKFLQGKKISRLGLHELPIKPGMIAFADNYLEAAGMVSALRAGVALDSVQRPMARTRVSFV